MPSVRKVMILSGLALVWVVGCSAQGGEEATTTSGGPADTSTSTGAEPPDSTAPKTPITPNTTALTSATYLSDDLIEQVKTQASDESGVPAADFQVETAARVTWSDGSLGCPQPGQSYTQALVDGYWIVLGHEGETFDYRATLDADFRRCVGGMAPSTVFEDR
jgi:hypothetical protein